ncbi:CNH domain-containing protein [Pseudomassariella vexata]|uniref:CNH domain-domain-containing protein n=1 Tax=Pseudomassariella vexata TaxID=1141098 RepID=A0A1Y2E8P2_9PEZI|nr:CNH domain-containing protein [Pseudomassariella vexata]ORY67684.1 CNH domain-domain-containing protein [Pseudomassariella vexata]
MSFRGDDQRRYGHIPPVQYPVANQQAPEQPTYLPRRPSFNSGDDSALFDSAANRQHYPPPVNTSTRGHVSEDELFLASPTDSSRPNHGSSNVAMSGYQHQYTAQSPPTPSTYNPQAFVRSQSTSLPPHPHPAANRYGAQSMSPYSPSQQTTNYTPAPYNPAAYSSTSPTAPQRQSAFATPGYGRYGNNQNFIPLPANPSPYYQAQPQYASPPAQTTQAPTPPPSFSPYDQTPTNSSSHDPSYSYPSPNAYSNSATSPGAASYSSASSQAPYPTYSQIPVGPNYSANDPNSFISRGSRSQVSPLPSPPIQPQTSPGLLRHPTNAPLPSRPNEHIKDDRWGSNGAYGKDDSAEHITQDNIMQDIEAELAAGGGSRRGRPHAFDQHDGVLPDGTLQNLRRLTSSASYNSTATTVNAQDDASGVNRYSSNASTLSRNHSVNPNSYTFREEDGDESDPEGAAGVLAMQQADEDDRRLSVGVSFPYFSQPEVSAQQPLPNLAEESTSDSDYAAMDIGLFSGGYPGSLVYDNNLPETESIKQESQILSTPRSKHASQRSHDSNKYPAFEEANIDYGGTGGLLSPSEHRLSFDEGDERVSLHSRQSGSESPYKEDYPDMFYHPGLSNRPLPAIPAGSDSSSLLSVQSPNRPDHQHGYSLSVDSRPYSGSDAAYGQNVQQLQVERSISLSSHSTSPQVQPPARSRTDAEDRNRRLNHMRQQQLLAAQQGLPYEGYDSGAGSSINYDAITLPVGRRKKFLPEKLTVVDTRSCTEPWALSGISNWVREMAEGEPDLKRKTVEDGLVRLFCFKVPTMNVADAEALGATVVDLMLQAGILVPEEEWLKFGPGTITGVMWQLTGSGCYAPKLHEFDNALSGHEVPGRCYSHHCGRTLKKANLDELMSEGVKKVDWATYYGMTPDGVEGKHKKEIERQNVLHEIVTSEEEYNDQLDVLRILYRDQLTQSQPRIIAEGKIDKFVGAVFGKAEGIQQANKDHLLAQLKYRQKEQGPWIIGFSDIFREWIRKARVAYVEYASAFPYAQYLVRREADRNFMFRQFLDNNRSHPRSKKLDWTTFLKAPITRLQRYNLLLGTSLKNMIGDSEEKATLHKAMEEIKHVGLEMDAKVDEMQKKVTMIELDQMLVLRPGYHADLNLDHLGRELITQGDLQRMGSKGVRWVDTHALLFDHYLILAKLVTSKDGRQDRKYDVSKEPIPMPLLFLESSQDEPVSKQKGIAAPLTRAAGSTADIKKASDTKLNKVTSNGSERPGLEHTPTTSSMGSIAVTRLTQTNSTESEGKILYPFRVKHLGHEVYTLFAPSAHDRQIWCDKLIEAKTRHAKALHAQNAEPFRLRAIADSAFGYDTFSGIGKYVGGVHIRGTPLDRAIRELEKTFGPGRGPPPISRAPVNCAAGFTAYGRNMIAIGTDVGVCVAEAGDQRGWLKTVSVARVTQIAVLEEFSVVLILADRSLVSYPLDVISPPSNFPTPANDNPRRSPVRLSKDVSFFATARMKDRMLVFYKKREGLHSTFKVLEPVLQKATEKKTRLFGGRKVNGSTESFRDYDDFYLPAECYSLNIFQNYIAISTSKGFELMTLDKKVPMSIPDVKQPAIANIANRIRDQRPLGMFKLNDQEFLLAYEDCAVYIDKHGDVSRSVIMEYSGKQKKAKGSTLYGQYLLLFNEDYVEVRNAENGRLRQIIAGRDVRVLDYGVRGPTGGFYQTANGYAAPAQNEGGGAESKGTVKICMAHPEVANQQIVLEMLLNNGHTEA